MSSSAPPTIVSSPLPVSTSRGHCLCEQSVRARRGRWACLRAWGDAPFVILFVWPTVVVPTGRTIASVRPWELAQSCPPLSPEWRTDSRPDAGSIFTQASPANHTGFTVLCFQAACGCSMQPFSRFPEKAFAFHFAGQVHRDPPAALPEKKNPNPRRCLKPAMSTRRAIPDASGIRIGCSGSAVPRQTAGFPVLTAALTI